jgi:hypothetical protein
VRKRLTDVVLYGRGYPACHNEPRGALARLRELARA